MKKSKGFRTFALLIIFFACVLWAWPLKAQDPLTCIDDKAVIVVQADDLMGLISAIEDQPIWRHRGWVDGSCKIFGEHDAELVSETLTSIIEGVRDALDLLKPKRFVFEGHISENGTLGWSLFVQLGIEDGDTAINEIHESFSLLKTRNQIVERMSLQVDLEAKLSWKVFGEWLVVSDSQRYLDILISRLGGQIACLKPLSQSRRFLTVFNSLANKQRHPNRVTLYVDSKWMRHWLGPDSFSSGISDFFGINEVLGLGFQFAIFPQPDSNNSAEREPYPIVGCNGFVILAVPRVGFQEAFAQPIKVPIPIGSNVDTLTAIHFDALQLRNAARIYYEPKDGPKVVDRTIRQMLGLNVDVETLINLMEGTIAQYTFESNARTESVDMLRMLDQCDGPTFALNLARASSKGDKFARGMETRRINEIDIHSFGKARAVASINSWLVLGSVSAVESLAKSNEIFDNSSRSVEFGSMVNCVQRQFSHKEDPFFVLIAGEHTQKLFLSDLRQEERKVRPSDPNSALPNQINLDATPDIIIAIFESIGPYVLIASSSDRGIHVSGAIFSPLEQTNDQE